MLFGLFGNKNSEREKLQKRYEDLLAESYKLSTKDRKASDLKRAEAEEIAKQLEKIISRNQ